MSQYTPAPPRAIPGWLLGLIGFGLFWLIAGVGLTPGVANASSLYHNIEAVALFLPGLWLCFSQRRWLLERLRARPELAAALALLAWGAVSLAWAQGNHLGERIKIPLQIVTFVAGWLCWTGVRGEEAAATLLRLAGYALALGALVAIVAMPWRVMDFPGRIIGFAMLDGPNLSGYVMGAAAVWLYQLRPPGRRERWFWLACLASLLVFCAMTQSRGTWLAVFVSMLALPLLHPRRRDVLVALAALAGATVVAVVERQLLVARGQSHRLEIWQRAEAMIAAHPWRGIGLDTPYAITIGAESWTHSHNLFTNLAIELGVPALLVWLAIWVAIAWRGWRHRAFPAGRVVLGIWIFSTIALQLDGPALLLSPRPEWLLTWLPLAISAGWAIPANRSVQLADAIV
jgi:O-antigen ligase